jgi:hypothetical protein
MACLLSGENGNAADFPAKGYSLTLPSQRFRVHTLMTLELERKSPVSSWKSTDETR